MGVFADIVEKVKDLPEDKFPSFLFDVQFHTYEDNPFYFYEYDMSDPRLRFLETVPKLRDYYNWEDLTKIWYSYMEDMASKYGITVEMLVQLGQLGLIDEFLPDKPMMRPKEFKRIQKYGVPTKYAYSDAVGHDLLNLMTEVDEEEDPEIVKIPEEGVNPEIEPMTRQDERDADLAINRFSSEERRKNFRRSKTLDIYGIGLAAVEKAFTAPSEDDDWRMDLTEVIEEARKAERMTEAEKYAQSADGVRNSLGALWTNGQFMKADVKDRIDMMAKLEALGYDAWQFYDRKRMSKSEIKLIESSIPSMAQLSDKKRKKLLKRQEKEAMRHQGRLNSLASVLTKNGYSFGVEDDDDVPPFYGFSKDDLYRT